MSRLKRELGLLDAVMIGMGGTVGTGVFIILAYTAGVIGPLVVIPFILTGIFTLLSALDYCELASTIPIAGGGYTFTKRAIGELPAFATGWFMWFGNAAYASFCALGFAECIGLIVNYNRGLMPVIAIAVILVFTFINYIGSREAGRAQSIITIILLLMLCVLAMFGFLFLSGNPTILDQPIISPGVLPFFHIISYIWVMFVGFEIISTASEEIRDAEKNIPRAIIITVILSTLMYTVIAFLAAYSGVAPDVLTTEPVPLSPVAISFMGGLGRPFVGLVGMGATLSSLNAAMIASTRIAYAMSRDGYFPKSFGKVHYHYGSPYMALAMSSIVALAFAGSGFIDYVIYMTDFCYIIGLIIINYSVIRLREREPDLSRPFKVRWYPFIPIAAMATLFMLIPFIEEAALVTGSGLVIVAILAYYTIMIGYERIRVALGGMNIIVGTIILAGSLLLLTSGTTAQTIALLIAVVFFVAGALHIAAKKIE